MRINFSFFRLPIVSLECFSNGKWKCMPREIDNYFLYKEINPQTSVQFRATSISGQTIGFTLEDLNSIKEVKLSQQFQPFHTGKCQTLPQVIALSNNLAVYSQYKADAQTWYYRIFITKLPFCESFPIT